MALNDNQTPGINAQVTKASVASGDPVIVGAIHGIAQGNSFTDAAGNANQVIIRTDGSIWNLSVKGVDGSGNHAIAQGDPIYIVDGDTPKLSAKTAGVLFGYAMDPVGSGATTPIRVKHKYL